MRPASTGPERVAKADSVTKVKEAEARPAGPLLISVSLARQRLTVFDANGPIAESPISSGRIGYATPTGIFTILEKNKIHHSNLYSGAPMPNMQRLTWSGVALHAGALPGYPASHGCIRLPHGFSQKLFGMTKMGARVIVSREPVAPAAFTHDQLFAAFPPENELKSASNAGSAVQVAANTTALESGGDVGAASIGLGAAAAVDGAMKAEPAKLSFQERRRKEAEELTAAIRTAGYRKLEASVFLASAAREAERARVPYNKARVENLRLTQDSRQALAQKDDAYQDLANFNRKIEGSKTADSDANIQEKKRALEDKAAAAADAADLADDALKTAIEAMKVVEDASLQAERKRRLALSTYSIALAELSASLKKEQDMKRREAKRALPVSVFISRKTQRLYVRQGFEPILDAAVTFDRPEEPVGTHVLTALDYGTNKTKLTWSAVSVQSGAGKSDKTLSRKERGEVAAAAAAPASALTATAALDRIKIPDEAREQIVDLMKPGSSVVISDNGISGETGEYTDFIVLTR
ncbi:MAG: L,D-transpeptidase [Hyphomicrobium sp.]